MSQPPSASPLPFVDLAAQRARLGPAVDQAIARVLEHGRFIMGPEVARLEQVLARFCGARHAIACASGTDALLLGLLALETGPGDAVIVPAFTFAATAEAVALLGATPVFVDIDPVSFCLEPTGLEPAIALARSHGLRPRGVIPVDLFGQPCAYPAIEEIAARHGLWLLADAAQSFGARFGARAVGTIGRATATSFFPAKPLGCYGDGGAILTDDDALAATCRSLRVHGQGTDKYDNARIGLNARLDTLQAAILLEKLAIFPDEIERRNAVAQRYTEALAPVVRSPKVDVGNTSVWAQYTIVLEAGRRDQVAADLKAAGVPTAVYYPRPLHRQTAYRSYPVAGPKGRLPVSEAMAAQVLSLPMHPYLSATDQNRVVAALTRACRAGAGP